MVGRGLFAEVEALLAEGLSPGSTAMQAIGYKEAAAALRGECSRAEAIETIKRETRSLREAPANLAAPPRGGPAHRLAGQTRFCVRRPGFDRISAPLRYMIVAYRAR